MLVIMFFFGLGELCAIPPSQHLVEGVVISVDLESRFIVIEPAAKTGSMKVFVEDKRTRLRVDKDTGTLRSLPVGQRVRIYYRQEVQKIVAIEITWSAKETPEQRSRDPSIGAGTRS